MPPERFEDYRDEGAQWITLAGGDFYPDVLPNACALYEPVLRLFGELVRVSNNSNSLLLAIADTKNGAMRIQLARVFRKYVSPQTPVEMLKRKSAALQICADFGHTFRPLDEVRAAFEARPMPDEALCALLWEYKDRGQKGYDLTERLFAALREAFPHFTLIGPERAGRDVLLGEVFAGYPKPDRPVDFVLSHDGVPVAIGLARYDGDRGGAQEDDRTGQYRDCAAEILGYANKNGLPRLKVIFINDGPGLLLGSMWSDYAYIENAWPDRVRVATLKMVPKRITEPWILS